MADVIPRLGGDLGPILAQLHLGFPYDQLANLGTFLSLLPSRPTRAFVFANNQFEGHRPATAARLGTLPAT